MLVMPIPVRPTARGNPSRKEMCPAQLFRHWIISLVPLWTMVISTQGGPSARTLAFSAFSRRFARIATKMCIRDRVCA